MKTKTKDILTLLKSSDRKLYVIDDVAKTAPVNEGEIEFFKLGRYVTDDELQTEYDNRGLIPVSLHALLMYDKEYRDKLDEMEYVGTHWKDAKGNWCCATFYRWFDERGVLVDRSDDGWSDYWWFAGVRKSALSTKKLRTKALGSLPLDLESAIKIVKKSGVQNTTMKKTKKETTLKVLQDIRKAQEETNLRLGQLIVQTAKSPLEAIKNVGQISSEEIQDLGFTFKIYIPKIAMKEIFEKSNNKTSKGTPLFYDNTWYKNESFYTTETSREGWYEISKELIPESQSKTWDDQEKILKEKGGIRLNAAETLYILYAYEKQYGVRLLDGWHYNWTSARSSDGYLVIVGAFDGGGVRVADDYPRDRYDFLGAWFARRVDDVKIES